MGRPRKQKADEIEHEGLLEYLVEAGPREIEEIAADMDSVREWQRDHASMMEE